MANPSMYCTELDAIVFTTSGGDDASYPVTNLNTYIVEKYWKSANNTNGQSLVLDAAVVGLGSANKNYIIIEAHNFDSIEGGGGRVRIQHANNSGFTSATTLYDSQVAQPLAQVLSFNSTSQRYFRVLFDNCASLVPQIGRIFLGLALDIPFPYDNPSKPGNRGYSTAISTSLNGLQRGSQAYGGRKRWDLAWSGQKGGLSAATRTSWISFFKVVRGRLLPFYFLDTDQTLHFVRLGIDVDPNQIFRNNVNDFPGIILESQTVS